MLTVLERFGAGAPAPETQPEASDCAPKLPFASWPLQLGSSYRSQKLARLVKSRKSL